MNGKGRGDSKQKLVRSWVFIDSIPSMGALSSTNASNTIGESIRESCSSIFHPPTPAMQSQPPDHPTESNITRTFRHVPSIHDGVKQYVCLTASEHHANELWMIRNESPRSRLQGKRAQLERRIWCRSSSSACPRASRRLQDASPGPRWRGSSSAGRGVSWRSGCRRWGR